MRTLVDFSPNYVVYKNQKYRVNISYDNILLLYQLYDEEILGDGDKIRQAIRLLVKNRFKAWLLSELEKAELFELITREKIALPERPRIGTKRKLMDFEADGDYIYASFSQAYGMDLIKERGRLQWNNFCELLDGLPEKTKLKEVMRIRAMDIPEPTKYNQKERKNLMELKAYYALPVKKTDGQKELDMLFSMLEKMAKK